MVDYTECYLVIRSITPESYVLHRPNDNAAYLVASQVIGNIAIVYPSVYIQTWCIPMDDLVADASQLIKPRAQRQQENSTSSLSKSLFLCVRLIMRV